MLNTNILIFLGYALIASGVSNTHGISTVKRRKKSSAAPNQRKMFEEVDYDTTAMI